jgi:hypothetical protein
VDKILVLQAPPYTLSCGRFSDGMAGAATEKKDRKAAERTS